METGGDPLGKLLHFGTGDHFPEFGLPEEDDLEKLAAARFKICQKPQLLEHIEAEVLGLIDDKNGMIALGVDFEEVTVEAVDKDLGASGPFGIVDAELVADRSQEFHCGKLGVKYESDFRLLGQALEETSENRRFPRPHLSGEKNEAASALDTVDQMGQGLPVLFAGIEIAGVRSQGKWLLLHSEMSDI